MVKVIAPKYANKCVDCGKNIRPYNKSGYCNSCYKNSRVYREKRKKYEQSHKRKLVVQRTLLKKRFGVLYTRCCRKCGALYQCPFHRSKVCGKCDQSPNRFKDTKYKLMLNEDETKDNL